MKPSLTFRGWGRLSNEGHAFSRAGLTNPKQKKRRTTPYSEPFSEVTAPNQLWCTDFKGYFSTGDGTRCDPFTITDAYSRYLIRCQTVSRMDLSQVLSVCEAAMHEYGMPTRIRTDKGAPFAENGLLGLSKLSLSWIKMGIVHERIQPGRRQQNGRHERMHRTYPRGFLTRRVNSSGDISWHEDRIFMSEVFSFEDLGFEEMDEDFFRVYFYDIELSELDVAELRFRSVRALP
jgi:transposase InsO family protein